MLVAVEFEVGMLEDMEVVLAVDMVVEFVVVDMEVDMELEFVVADTVVDMQVDMVLEFVVVDIFAVDIVVDM